MTSRKADPAWFFIFLISLLLSACNQKPADEELKLTAVDQDLVFKIIHDNSEIKSRALGDMDQDWILINFWSVSCPPCFEEMPDLDKAHKELNPFGFAVIGVAMSFDRPDMVLETLKKIDISYPIALDLEQTIEHAFGRIDVIPTSFLINSDGKLVQKYTGKVSYSQIATDLKKIQATSS